MTKKLIATNEAGELTGEIVFTFDDGTSQTFERDKVPAAVQARALMHGFSQKIGDSYASASKAENPLAFAKEAVRELIAQLYAGDWRAARAEGETGPRVSDLATVLARLTGKSIEESVEFVGSLTDDETKAWKAKGKVKAELDKLKAQRLMERAQKLAAKVGSADAGATDEEAITF